MSFQDTWANAPATDNAEQGNPPDPAIYTVELTDAAAVTAKATGKDWVILEVRAIGGDTDGHTWKVFHGFSSPQQAGFTKRVCRDLGVDTDTVADLAGLDDQLKLQVGRYFTVEVKQNGEYRNTYFQGAVDPSSFTLQPQADEVKDALDDAQQRLAAAAANTADEKPEDIPF